MKGIILAGGLGTRLHPLTKVTNKCLLPVYNKPMIYYPIQLMVDAGMDDILLVTGGNSVGEFLRVLGNGEDFGLKGLTYRVQSEPRGIADALSLAEDWAGDDDICVLLSDNIFEDNVKSAVDGFAGGAQVFLSQVAHPEHYGVAEIAENGNVVSIVEKPKQPKSNWAVTGLYMYDRTVWDFIRQLEPSARGELEITDVNNYYLREGKLTAHKLKGWWADCGENFDGYIDACVKVQSWEKKREIAYDPQAGIFYAYQLVQGEKLDDVCGDGEGHVCYSNFAHQPVCVGTVTGSVYDQNILVQQFTIDEEGNINLDLVGTPERFAKKGHFDLKTGALSLDWNQKMLTTSVVVNYEYMAN